MADASLWIVVPHATAAAVALPLGAWQLWRSEKGTTAHRLVGRVWVALLLGVSLSSFWIRELRGGSFSFLHVLSVVTIVTVTLGLLSAVRGQVEMHRGMMRGSWFGLVGAFVFAVAIPDRAIPTFALERPLGALAAVVAVLLAAAAVVALGLRTATSPGRALASPEGMRT